MKEHTQKNKEIKTSLRRKVFRMNVWLLAVAIVFFAVIGVLQFRRFADLMEQTNRNQNEVIMDTMSETVVEETTENFQKYVTLQSETLDAEFSTMRHDLEVLARQVQMVLEQPEAFSPQEVPLPSEAEAGELSLQLLYAEDADQTDEKLRDQILRIGGLRNMILEIVEGNDSLLDCMVSLPGGASIIADRTPESKVRSNGDIIPYNAERRPWYVGALVHSGMYFSAVNRDNYLGINEVMAGVPVYVDGELAAVCGGSLRIDDMEDMISKSQYGEHSNSCLINEAGNVIYSSQYYGELGMSSYQLKSLKEGTNADLVALVNTALEGGRGFSLLKVDGVNTYVAYAPVETVGWTLLLSVSEKDLNKTAYLLTKQTNAVTEESIAGLQGTADRTIVIIIVICIVLIAASIITSLVFAGRLVKPIKRMTMRVSEMQGTDMVFDIEDIYLTNDEIEVLARAFSNMSKKMQGYVREIVTITAEKQRLDTELSVASDIQTNMLPSHFPAFPDRKEFDLYAVMDPAKEVGGDFYDYYMIDDDHLALVMADVSGKGVPAALFMVVSKTVIKNAALSGMYKGPGEILKNANDLLCEGNEDCMFVTAWLGILTISTGKMVSACAGHEYPVFWRKDEGFVLERDKHGLSLGAMEGARYREAEWQMAPGDLLFLYTDGVPEATNSSEELFGNERMLQALTDSWDGCELETLLARVREHVDEYVGEAPQFDDLTMMCIQYKGC